MSIGPLLIRADASVTIGTGHVMRCLALAQAWQDAGGRVVFVTAGAEGWLQQRLTSEDLQVVAIAGYDEQQDVARLEQVAFACKATCLVVDGYHFTDDYFAELKCRGLRLLVVDDNGLNEYGAPDFVLNPNSDANQSMYPRRGPETKLLLGTKYALLRREFAAWRGWKRQTGAKVRRVLITMGGSDPDNITDLALQGLNMLPANDVEYIVVGGGRNPRLKNLEERASGISNRIRVLSAVKDVPALMAESDLAIIAAGGTLWELMYMSCPVVSFGRSPVQRRILEQLDAQGTVINMGDPRHTPPHDLAQAVDELSMSQARRARMAQQGRERVDGEGAERVCRILANSK